MSDTDKDSITIFKHLRKMLKPEKMCDYCINEWSSFTLEEEKLCESCYREKYVKTKVG
jgi:hypothetical protein